MRPDVRIALSSLALLVACGEPIVGGSPLRNTEPMVAPIDDVVTNEDVPATVSVVLTDAESTDVLVVTATSSDQGVIADSGVVVSGTGADRTITLTPVLNASGVTTITVTIEDEDDYVITETFTVTVVAVDDPPTITAIDDLTIDEDGATTPIAFTVADVDTPLTGVAVTATSGDTTILPNAGVVLAGGGASYTVTLTPAPNQNGSVTVTVSAADATTTTNETFVLTVTSVNDVPTISDITDLSTNEDTPTGAIPFTITDVESLATLQVTAATSDAAVVPTANVAIACDAAGSCTVLVTPAPDMNGPVTITLTVSDGTDTAQDSFVLTVLPVHDNPLISAIADQTIEEDTTTGPLMFTVTAIDQDDDEDDFTFTTGSSNPAVIPNSPANIVITGTGMMRTVEVIPAPNQFDLTPVTITITVTDDDGLSASEMFTVTVTRVNDAPTFTAVPADQMLLEDAANATRNVTIDDIDVEDPEVGLVFTAVSSDPTILAVTTGGAGANRTVILDPQLHRFGTVTIMLSVSDGEASNTAMFDVTVTQVNDAPTITRPTSGTINIFEDAAPTTIVIAVADVDRGDGGFPPQAPLQTLTVTTAFTTNNPDLIVSAVPNGDNTAIILTIAPDENGPETLTVTVTDDGPGNLSANLVIPINVIASNDPPSISQVPNQTGGLAMLEDTNRTVSFDVADIDLPAQTLTVTAVSSNQMILPQADFVITTVSGVSRTVQLTLDPALNAFGNGTTITVTVSDGIVSADMTFTVDVLPVNDVPTISAIANQTVQEDTGAHSYTFTVSDVDDVVDCGTVTVTSSNPTLAMHSISLPNTGTVGQCSITMTTQADQVGVTNVVLRVSDDEPSLSAPEPFTFTVTNVNDPPIITIVSASPQTTNEDTTSGPVTFTVTDIDNPPCAVTISSTTSNATLLPTRTLTGCTAVGDTATRTLTVTPGLDQYGSGETITLTANDGALADSDTFGMNVLPVNDPPTISNVTNVTVTEDAMPAPTVAFTIDDVDDTDTQDCDDVTFTSTDPTLATIAITGTGGSCTATFTVPANRNGATTVTLTTTDAASASASDSFDFTVTPGNDPPTISVIADTSTDEDTTSAQIAFTVTDIDGPLVDPACGLTLTSSSSDDAFFPPAGRTFQPAGSCTEVGDSATRFITVLPALNVFGTGRTITVTVSDGLASASETFVLDVNPVNDPPTAVDDNVTVQANRTVTGNVLTNDTDVEVPVTLSAVAATVTQPGEGTLVLAADGSFTFTAAPGVVGGPFTFPYTVQDAGTPQLSDTGSVIVTINGPIIWYVNNTNTVAGDGTTTNPFRALASAEAASAANQQIIVECGDGTTAQQNVGIDLKSGQTLTGTANLVFSTGMTGCTRPRITGPVAIGLADGVTVSNFDIAGATTNGILSGNVSGTITLSNIAITGSTNSVSLVSSGSPSFSLTSVSVATGTGVGFEADFGGTLTATNALNVSMTSGRPLRLEDFTVGGTELTFATVSTPACTTGTAVLLNNLAGGRVGIDALNVTTTTADGLSVTDSDLRVADGSIASGQRGLFATDSGLNVQLDSLDVNGTVTGLELTTVGVLDVGMPALTASLDVDLVTLDVVDAMAVDMNDAGLVRLGDGTSASYLNVSGANARPIRSSDTEIHVSLERLDTGATSSFTRAVLIETPTTSTSDFTVRGTGGAGSGGTLTADGVEVTGRANVTLNDMVFATSASPAVDVTDALSLMVDGCAFNGSSGAAPAIVVENVADVTVNATNITNPGNAGISVTATNVVMSRLDLDTVNVTRSAAGGTGTNGVLVTVSGTGRIATAPIDAFNCAGPLSAPCVDMLIGGTTVGGAAMPSAFTFTGLISNGAQRGLVVTQTGDADVTATITGSSVFTNTASSALWLATNGASSANGTLTVNVPQLRIGTEGTSGSGSAGYGLRITGEGASHMVVTLGDQFDVFEVLLDGINVSATNGTGRVSFNADGISANGVGGGADGIELFARAGNGICSNIRNSTFLGEASGREMTVDLDAGAVVTVPGYSIMMAETASQALFRVMTAASPGLNNVLSGGASRVGVLSGGTITAAATCN